MHAQRMNRISGRLLTVLSFVALVTVLTGYTMPRHPAPTDEGAAAHIFQLAVLAFAPALMLFLVTSDWTRPSRSVRPIAIPAAALTVAFVALYGLEHYWLY